MLVLTAILRWTILTVGPSFPNNSYRAYCVLFSAWDACQ
jgi:hypothetical protein